MTEGFLLAALAALYLAGAVGFWRLWMVQRGCAVWPIMATLGAALAAVNVSALLGADDDISLLVVRWLRVGWLSGVAVLLMLFRRRVLDVREGIRRMERGRDQIEREARE